MSSAVDVKFSHLGIYVKDMAAMVEFYTKHLGLQVTDRGPLKMPGEPEIVFLSSDPKEHHQMALLGGRDEREANTLQQIAFDVGSLDDLKRLKAGLEEDGVTSFRPVNHGNAWSIYFPDPEGNNIECFVRTPWYVDQPCGDRLDLSLSNEEMLAATKKAYEDDPTFQPVEEWSEAFAERLRS